MSCGERALPDPMGRLEQRQVAQSLCAFWCAVAERQEEIFSRRPLNLQRAPSCLIPPRRNAANPTSAGARHAEVSARVAESRLALNQQPVIVTFTTPGCYFKS